MTRKILHLFLFFGLNEVLAQADCSNTSEGLTPLIDLATTYNDSTGGLYRNGSNTIPAAHDSIGRVRALEVAPRDANGLVKWDGTGKIVLLTVGGSTIDRPSFFMVDTLAAMTARVRPDLVFVNGGVVGTGNLNNVAKTTHSYWTSNIADSLAAKSVTLNQVQVIIVETIFNDTGPFNSIVAQDRDTLKAAAQRWQSHMPNLKLVLVDSRPYGGYAPVGNNQEPVWYQRSSFGHRAAIMASVTRAAGYSPVKSKNGRGNGMGEAAYMVWLSYSYADGTTARNDGLLWNCSDYEDGVHLAQTGRRKQVTGWLSFLLNNPIGKPWFLRNPKL